MFIQVQFRLKPEEYARGIASAFRRIHLRRQAIGLLGMLAGVVGVVFATGFRDVAGGVEFAALIYVYLNAPFARRLAARRQYAKVKSQSNTVTLTEDGLSWLDVNERGEVSMSMKWAYFTRLRETPEFFMFFTSKHYVHLAPKRAFDPQQAELFSRFVKYGFEEVSAAQRAAVSAAPAPAPASAPAAARPSR